MYQRKYWLVHTLLKVTKAKVWASIAPGRFFFASISGMITTDSSSCGMNASDSIRRPVALSCAAEFKCSSVLYTEKLWR